MALPHERLAWTIIMLHIAFFTRIGFARSALAAAVAIASAALCGSLPVFAQDAPAPAELTDTQWQLLESRISDRANEIANSKNFFEDDRRPITVEVKIDRATKSLIVELDLTFGKEVGDLPLEDFMSAIAIGMEDLTELIPQFYAINWVIGGRDMDYWFGQLIDSPMSRLQKVRHARAANDRAKIVVAAGHGFYFHTKYKWTAQREKVNGVLEDEITQAFARQLAFFTERNMADPVRIRGGEINFPHGPSGRPWPSIAARYFIENWRPDNPELWNSKPESTDPQRERQQDIRSRPLYANWIGADAVAHIHTNAGQSSATGTRIIVHPGRVSDLKLAQLSLCSMKEAIHSDALYAEYVVPMAPLSLGGKGENSIANVPSMIVEVGFHTNVDDARILQQPTFQKLSMRGLAKGMRLFREGRTCAPFVVAPVAPFTGIVGRDVRMPITISGNPVYPVHLISTRLNCPQGMRCGTDWESVYNKKDADGYSFGHLCRQGDETRAPAEFRVEAKDFDGLLTPPVTYQVKCTKA